MIINLQSKPSVENVTKESVTFASNGIQLKGTVYKPKDLTGTRPAAVVTGAWTTVKEQMPGTYARELAVRGLIALAFDFTGWGESGGDSSKRYIEDPSVKTEDIVAAVEYMVGRQDVDKDHLYGLGVCASSGYMAAAAADNQALKKVALVAPWLHDPKMAEEIYGGPEATQKLIAAAEATAAAKEPTILACGSTTDETAIMFKAPYYSESDRGLIPEYDNKFNVAGWKPWLSYNAQASAGRIEKPMLMVGSDSIALPAGATAYEKCTKAPLEKVWLGSDVTQFDFYDRADVVEKSADAVAEFFQK
eukprot:CAMPEP_0168717850 /NCGR_PEP_ID=MMETSP0724-20121128/211_1 /TAXON_ID=265536 /ORGANISM="Amphiprora sp., Strain CCMP467" /LENGTH=304 /DNA_ID=CAMNT_0008764337 /DNA_START=85 /DNA_END=999 /DNA_ORIENTATION=-